MAKTYFCSIPRTLRIETDHPQDTLQVKFVDLSLGDLNVDYPLVSKILYRTTLPFVRVEKGARIGPAGGAAKSNPFAGRPARSVDWLPCEAVQRADWARGVICVPGGIAGQKMEPEEVAEELLIGRDILDAAIIDLPNRRVTRANDLLLADGAPGAGPAGCEGELRLEAADISVHALLRRLSGGYYRKGGEGDLVDWRYVDFLRGDPGAVQAGKAYQGRIKRLQPGEIVHIAEGLPYLHAAELILLLPDQLAADIFELMSAERQLQIFEELDEPFALQVLAKMAPDAACDLIGLLPPMMAPSYLAGLPAKPRERVVELLRYPADSVGGIMTNDMIALPARLSVAEARERLRKQLLEPDFVHFIYVVDGPKRRRLLGVITLRNMLVAGDGQKLEEIMNPYLLTLHPLDAPKTAAYRLIDSQIAALPVVDTEGRLLGVVTVDAAINQVAPDAWSSQAPRIFS